MARGQIGSRQRAAEQVDEPGPAAGPARPREAGAVHDGQGAYVCVPGKSHSVTANLQRVFALLKAHNPQACTVCNRDKGTRQGLPTSKRHGGHGGRVAEDPESDEEELEKSLYHIVQLLEDEFRHLKMVTKSRPSTTSAPYSNATATLDNPDPIRGRGATKTAARCSRPPTHSTRARPISDRRRNRRRLHHEPGMIHHGGRGRRGRLTALRY
ncbi:hypothetical protein BC938DRAFT_480671 [Jimgerdemannia flammicorona]|uniref:Uncharacterized protein n=1 Tax=Jimgerdemannia flammicorona TaxID=994334 RepID=A0A433QI11_9FUNG|nr:hypothetical protein BC938DRAFT_480671 [Jimgerdemannia flammicorona]